MALHEGPEHHVLLRGEPSALLRSESQYSGATRLGEKSQPVAPAATGPACGNDGSSGSRGYDLGVALDASPRRIGPRQSFSRLTPERGRRAPAPVPPPARGSERRGAAS
jgi:hypothetical protein